MQRDVRAYIIEDPVSNMTVRGCGGEPIATVPTNYWLLIFFRDIPSSILCATIVSSCYLYCSFWASIISAYGSTCFYFFGTDTLTLYAGRSCTCFLGGPDFLSYIASNSDVSNSSPFYSKLLWSLTGASPFFLILSALSTYAAASSPLSSLSA